MQQPVVHVGEWLVTPSVNQISRQGRQITLEPRLIDLLIYFAHHPDEVLSRDEIIDNVWMRTIVTSHVVTQSISELRKYLRDGNENSPEYIVTVPKRGYKLTAPVVWSVETDDEAESLPADMPAVTAPLQASSSSGTAATVPSSGEPPLPKSRERRLSRFWTWCLFLVSLTALIAMVALSMMPSHPEVTKTRLLLNPRDIDVRFDSGNSCNNWASQEAYAIGLGSLITTSLNTFSTFMVHDKTNYNVDEPSSSGKTLTIRFANQRHYRAQQCFMSVLLVDNADGATMLDKRYFITDTNQFTIQDDIFDSLSTALTQPWPARMQGLLAQFRLPQSSTSPHFYEAYQLLLNGDVQSLNKASTILETISKNSPEFVIAYQYKVLVDVLRHSQQPFNSQQMDALNNEFNKIAQMPGIEQNAVFYKIQTIDLLGKGNVDGAFDAINKSIDLEMSWMNYLLLGKVYEMKGESRLAADAYITAFNLRPGENTMYWIENGVFQTSIKNIVPYLDSFLAEK